MSARDETVALRSLPASRGGSGRPRRNDRPVNLRILLGGLPVAVFYVLTRFAPAWVAIGGGFLASLFVFRLARTSGLLRLLTAFSLSILTVAGALGVVWDSEKAYLAAGPTADLLWPVLYGGSIVARRPLVGAIAREMVPRLAGPIPVNDRLFVRLSVMWGAVDLARGIILIWFLRHLSVGEYIVYSRMFSWPFNLILLVITVAFIVRRARALRADLPPAMAPASP